MHLEHPYDNLTGGAWLRGTFHAHTTCSDGLLSQQALLDTYSDLGYDFLAISDHDIFTGPDDYKKLDGHGLILISGNEISKGGSHMLHIGGHSLIEPGERQQALNAIRRDGGFAVINHPNWLKDFDSIPISQLRAWDGYLGMEIYNGVIGRLEGSPYAAGKWDMLLTDGRRLWGFANDDFHAPGDSALGWNMVYATAKTPEAVIDATVAGRFYASSGVVIDEITVSEDRIVIATSNASRIVALKESGIRIAVSDSSRIELTAPRDAKYVRFECWGDGESFAWTQPFHVAGR